MSNEWYTPSIYIEAAKEVMGSIDLDPASCEYANKTVRARTYYTKEDNGLNKYWYGNIWLNPPFGRVNGMKGGGKSWQGLFAKRLYENRDNIEQAIMLALGNSFYRDWFQDLWAYPICIHRKDIYFEKEDGKIGHFGFGSTFIYIGPNKKKFIQIFSQFGPIIERII